jgi:ABC-type transport system involved in cytochrome c biogenesis permease subunit
MTWQNYPTFIYFVIPLWILGLLFIYFPQKKLNRFGLGLLISGLLVLVGFTIQLWINLERPPFKTLGETRLWYGLFLSLIGLVLYFRWGFKWILVYSTFLSSVFLLIIFFSLEIFDQTLMPALQSPWFVPHVIVYLFAYALLSAAALIGAKGILFSLLKKDNANSLAYADNLVYIGFAFLSFGLLFGALWAKEAWGHYWTWDPKETWALITWLVYLIYIHYRLRHKESSDIPFWILAFAMAFVLICWMGINYLPAAQTSVHTY